jgi:hypothetical protein
MSVDSAVALSNHLKPLCSRDDHTMKYESGESQANTGFQASYHCRSTGCSVRYNTGDGYFMLMGAPHHTYTVEEPGINSLKCPTHNHWLYRRANKAKARVRWYCGVEGCDYDHDTSTKATRK